MSAIKRRVPLSMKFELRGNDSNDIKPGLIGLFSDPFALEGEDFVRERQRLVELLSESQWKRMQSHPAHVTLLIYSVFRDNIQCIDTEDLFVDLARFAAAVEANDQNARIDRSATFLPMTLVSIKLRLRQVWITPRILEKATDLVATGVPVKLRELHIDPLLVHCTEEELQCFVGTLTKVKSKVRVFIGQLVPNGDIRILDSRGQDRTQLIRMIVNAVISLPTLSKLEVSSLFGMLAAPMNRRVVIEELLMPLLSRPKPLDILFIDFSTWTQEDIDCYRAAADEWRQRNPGKQLRVNLVGCGLDEGNGGPLNPLAYFLDDAQDVRLYPTSFDSRRLATSMIRAVLRYPSLTSLVVEHFVIESMELFDPLITDSDVPVKPVLQKLRLEDCELEDQLSMGRFLRLLGDASHPLSRSLQRFIIRGDIASTETYAFSAEDTKLLAAVLHNNHALAHVSLTLAPLYSNSHFRIPDHASITRQVEDLQVTDRRGVPKPDQRRADYQKTRVLAFLSVVQSDRSSVPKACRRLDSGVLSVILDFSAPHQSRFVSAKTIIDEDEDDEED